MFSSRHDEVLDRHLGVADGDLVLEARVQAVRQDGDVAHDPVARVGQLDEERRELAVARRLRIGLGHHERQLGGAGTAGEPLLAVQHPVVAVAHGRRLHPRGVGTGGLLGHREADPDVAVDERLEVALLLVLGAVLDERDHRGVLRTHAVEGPGREHGEGATDLDLHDGVGQVPEPHAAPLLGDERAPQALRPGLALQLADDVEVRPRAHLRLGGEHVVIDELRHPRPQRVDVLGDLEVNHLSDHACHVSTLSTWQSKTP